MNYSDFSYYNTIDQIYHAEWSLPKLARLEFLRESIQTLWPNGHPTRLIHVAGTGGKGSTCRFLELSFSCVGKSGAFMSPHLFDYRERFSIDGEFVKREDITEAWETRVKPHCIRLAMRRQDHYHTYLQSTILIALTLFEKYEVEWAAIEAFLGGRYDHTRALDVVATLLTNVGSDHAHLLGREQWQRVLDKVGIARTDIPFFTTEQNPENQQIIEAICREIGAPLYTIEAAEVKSLEQKIMTLLNGPIPPESLLSAPYQRWNASLAFATIQHLCPDIHEQQVFEKLVQARLVGRFWQVDEHVFADIAHNAEKISALAGEIQMRFEDRNKILVIGLSRHRVPLDVFESLAQVARTIIITGASFRGQDPHEIQRQIAPLTQNTPTLVIAEPRQALQVAQSMWQDDDVIILTGSTYMIEQVLNPDSYMRYLNSTFGWRMETHSQATGTVELTLPTENRPIR